MWIYYFSQSKSGGNSDFFKKNMKIYLDFPTQTGFNLIKCACNIQFYVRSISGGPYYIT